MVTFLKFCHFSSLLQRFWCFSEDCLFLFINSKQNRKCHLLTDTWFHPPENSDPFTVHNSRVASVDLRKHLFTLTSVHFRVHFFYILYLCMKINFSEHRCPTVTSGKQVETRTFLNAVSLLGHKMFL